MNSNINPTEENNHFVDAGILQEKILDDSGYNGSTMDGSSTSDITGNLEADDNDLEDDGKPLIVYDFDNMSPADLYDTFISDKQNKRGVLGRTIFVTLAKEKAKLNIPSVDDCLDKLGKKMARTKGSQQDQKNMFVQICDNYEPLVWPRVKQLFVHHIEAETNKHALKRKRGEATEGCVQLDVADSIAARVAHLAVETGAQDIMKQIFAVTGGRMWVDTKELRVGELWASLATRFINNTDWQLELFNDDYHGDAGVDYINPVTAVDVSNNHTGDDIKSIFNKLKSMYTLVHDKFHTSGQQEEGGQEFEDSIDSDSIFYNDFAKNFYPANARVLLYVHLLWGRAPPSFCLRTKKPSDQSQTGVEGTNQTETRPSSNKRELSLQKFAETLVGALNPGKTPGELKARAEKDQCEVEALKSAKARDDAVTKYYDLLSQEQEQKVNAGKRKYTPESFQDVEHMLRFARFMDQEIAHYLPKLFEQGFTDTFRMATLQNTPQLFQVMGFTIGASSALLAVLREIELFKV